MNLIIQPLLKPQKQVRINSTTVFWTDVSLISLKKLKGSLYFLKDSHFVQCFPTDNYGYVGCYMYENQPELYKHFNRLNPKELLSAF